LQWSMTLEVISADPRPVQTADCSCEGLMSRLSALHNVAKRLLC
jgi:hypothetical protein